MLNKTRSTLALVALTIVALSSLAQGAGANPNSGFLVSGQAGGETFVQSFYLSRVAPVDGSSKLMSPGECELKFKVSATGATGSGIVLAEDVVLGPGDLHVFKVPFSKIYSNHAHIDLTHIQRKGPCPVASSARLTGPEGETRSTYADRARFSEVVLATTPYKSQAASSSNMFLVSGSAAREGTELSFFLEKFSIVDGTRVPMSNDHCKVVLSVQAEGLEGTGGVKFKSIVLGPGDLDVFEFTFDELGGGHTLLEVLDAGRRGPCRLRAFGRIFDLVSGATVDEFGFVQRVPIQITGVEDPD